MSKPRVALLLEVLGAVAVVAGVAMLSAAAAYIVAGVLLIAFALAAEL